MWLTKSLVATALALTVSACATAHDSTVNDTKMPMQQGQMDCAKMDKHMKMMQNMDHDQMMQSMANSKMDMNDPATKKAMMAKMNKMMQSMGNGQMDMNDPATKKAMMAKMNKMYQQHCNPSKSKS